MPRRQSIPNGYPNRPGTRILPPSYQPEPIPMMNGSVQSFQPLPMAQQQYQHRRPSVIRNNSFKNNRVAPPPPQPMNYKTYSHPTHSFESQSSVISTNPLIQSSYKQPPMDKNYPNQSYYQQNNHRGLQPNGDIGENDRTSWWSKPLCLGLTRLSGGILFGTMIFLSLASIGGLITSVVLYIADVTTDPQWKILGMVVCAIMLLTVFVTLCIFIYCYKKGRIGNRNNMNNNHFNQNHPVTPSYNQENDYRHPHNYNQSAIPYGMVQNVSPTSTYEDTIQVHDKLTNTETTISPLRPRDFQRGVWNGNNAYGGVSYRPMEQPKMVHRVSQALPNEIDQIPSKQRNQMADTAPKTIVRLPEQRSRRFIEPQPQYDVDEEVRRKPKRRQSEEYVEIHELPKKGTNKQKFSKVSVKHVKTIAEPEVVEDDFNTDHFYQ